MNKSLFQKKKELSIESKRYFVLHSLLLEDYFITAMILKVFFQEMYIYSYTRFKLIKSLFSVEYFFSLWETLTLITGKNCCYFYITLVLPKRLFSGEWKAYHVCLGRLSVVCFELSLNPSLCFKKYSKEKAVFAYSNALSETESRNWGLGNNETKVIKLKFTMPEAMFIFKAITRT